MIRRFMKFLSILFLCACVGTAFGASNMSVGDIGDYGYWATDANHDLLLNQMNAEFENFSAPATKQLTSDYVPPEAKVGLAFMNALSLIGEVFDTSLVRFALIFMVIALLFWTGFETYKTMTAGKGGMMKLAQDIGKKWLTLGIWIIILGFGPGKLFMWIIGPIITVGTYMADLILGAVTSAAGAQLPDTCAAIHQYAVEHTSARMLIGADAAADMLCMPTRLSGFFYTAVAAGWEWVKYGIGHSAGTFAVGVAAIIIFAINIWKYAIMGLGVIADLFLCVLMLPFTAIAETVAKTSYKGIAGTIFNGFLGIFKAQKLDAQISKFINAAIYFVSLSIVIALCAALLAGTIDTDLASSAPGIKSTGAMATLLTGLLTWHLATQTSKIAKDLGGSVDDSFGTKVGGDVKNLWNVTNKKVKDIIKIIREN